MFLAGLWFLFLTFLPALHGATVMWVGGSGDWNTATNWSSNPSLPGTNDNVVIGAGASITVTHSSGTHTVQGIQSQQAFVLSGGRSPLALNDDRLPSANPAGWVPPVISAENVQTPASGWKPPALSGKDA